uniref:G-protein coupled receptors family 3 profile domain-containing protein n=1 Tax=Strigamia maritima TaxID=126957 RepID=T1IGY4_STRMM
SLSNIDDGEYKCPDGSSPTGHPKVISGVIGAASSVTSIQVANLLRLFKIPQFVVINQPLCIIKGQFSTSPELSNKDRFEYFSRTIPSDTYQVSAMLEIVKLMNWTYISIIFEESNYGIKAFEVLEDQLAQHNICIAVKERLVKDSGVAGEAAYDVIVQKLLSKSRAKGVIIFGSDQEVAGVMRAVRRNNATGRFSWIGSDGWSARTLVSDGNEREVEGTLSLQPRANPVDGFDEYFLGLSVKTNKRNPWFVEYWEDYFRCKYLNSPVTPYNQEYTETCTGDEVMTYDNGYQSEGQLQFVSDAVMVFAHAFKRLHEELCGKVPKLCEKMRQIDGSQLNNYVRAVNFTGLSGDEFHFTEHGDGPARYNIIHFKQISPSVFQWVRVGEYNDGQLLLNMSAIQFNLNEPGVPQSVCSLPCLKGQAKKYVEGEICCWHCFNCSQYQILKSEVSCQDCPLGTLPDYDHLRCLDIPEAYLRPTSEIAIGAMCFSTLGILLTLWILTIFIRHNSTPVVKASGRELSYVLLSGIFLCYAMTFVLVLRPTDFVCGVQKFGMGFCFAVVYSALLTKTNRILRIVKSSRRTARRPSFISPRSQLVICSGLVGIQIGVNCAWLFVCPPKAIHHHPHREANQLVCATAVNASYMIAFTYPIILIIVCTVYAVLTRKIPEAFNESKHIGFTMYTTCIIWLAFVPIYFSTAHNVPLRIITLSVSISLSATVSLACLFTPKLYIIILHPERNVRQPMMQQKYATKNSSLSSSSHRVDSATQSDDFEMQEKLRSAGSFSSQISRSTSATQTVSNDVITNMTSCSSTQTLNSINVPQPEDVQL